MVGRRAFDLRSRLRDLDTAWPGSSRPDPGGGEVLDTIELDRPCFAAMLGGPDRRTLFMLTAEWRGTDGMDEVIRERTGQILLADAPAPGVGWP